jgi:putative FmdB family regulatory protein
VPTYSYACKTCGHSFDAKQSINEPSLTSCPQCQGSLRKLFGSVGVVFKGSGFYRTDSRPKSSNRAEPKAPKRPESSSAPAPKPEPAASKPKEKVAA